MATFFNYGGTIFKPGTADRLSGQWYVASCGVFVKTIIDLPNTESGIHISDSPVKGENSEFVVYNLETKNGPLTIACKE